MAQFSCGGGPGPTAPVLGARPPAPRPERASRYPERPGTAAGRRSAPGPAPHAGPAHLMAQLRGHRPLPQRRAGERSGGSGGSSRPRGAARPRGDAWRRRAGRGRAGTRGGRAASPARSAPAERRDGAGGEPRAERGGGPAAAGARPSLCGGASGKLVLGGVRVPRLSIPPLPWPRSCPCL